MDFAYSSRARPAIATCVLGAAGLAREDWDRSLLAAWVQDLEGVR